MIQNIPSESAVISASVEISIMLLWAFTLWFILAWLIKPRQNFVVLDAVPLDEYKRSQLYPAITQKWAKKTGQKVEVEEKVSAVAVTEAIADKPADKLSLIHGITPKVEKVLKENNITSYQDILDADVEGLEEICLAAWINSKRYNITTWPDQARLAVDGHWRELEEYQAILQKKK